MGVVHAHAHGARRIESALTRSGCARTFCLGTFRTTRNGGSHRLTDGRALDSAVIYQPLLRLHSCSLALWSAVGGLFETVGAQGSARAMLCRWRR